MSTKNARILGIRLDETTNARLIRFEEATLIEGVSLARAALIAALDSYEQNESLTLPLKIVSASQSPRAQKDSDVTAISQIALLAETTAPSIASIPPRQETHYGSGTKRKKKSGTED